MDADARIQLIELRRILRVDGAGNGEHRAALEHVLDADVVPHALRKVRVEVAVEDRVAGGLVAVADAAVDELVGVARARHDLLGVQVVAVVVVRVEQPLVVVQVEDVLLERTGVDVADLDEVARVAVVDVGRVFLVQGVVVDEAARPVVYADRRVGYVDRVAPARLVRCRQLASKLHDFPRVALLDAGVGREVHQPGRVADGLRGEEELLVGAVGAVVHGPGVQAVGDDLRADAARAVVDHEAVPDAVDGVLQHRVRVPLREHLRVGLLVVVDRRELAEGLEPVGELRVVLAHALQRVGAVREAAVRLRADDDGVDVRVEQRVAVQHVEDRL